MSICFILKIWIEQTILMIMAAKNITTIPILETMMTIHIYKISLLIVQYPFLYYVTPGLFMEKISDFF